MITNNGLDIYTFDNFNVPQGGLTQINSRFNLSPSQYLNGSNLYNHGSIAVLQRRDGMTALGAQIHATNRIKSLYRGYSNNTTNVKWLLETDGTNIRYRAASSWSNLATTTTGDGLYWDFETYAGKVYMCDGASTPQVVTITTDPPTTADWTTMPSTFIPKFVRRWNNRIIIAGDTDLRDRVYISDFGTPTSFPASQFFRFRNNQSGEEIMKVEIINENMIVLFGANTIETWQGSGPLSLRRYGIIGGRGCIAGRTVVVINGIIYYVGKNGDYLGIYAFDGYNAPQLISYQVQALFRRHVNNTYISDMWAMNQDGKYVLFFTQKSQTNINNRWIEYDVKNDNWCGIHKTNDTIGYDCGVAYQEASGDTGQIYLGSSNGYVNAINDGTIFKDNTVSYPIEFETASFGADTKYNDKEWQECKLQFFTKEFNAIADFYYAVDEAQTGNYNATGEWTHYKAGTISLNPLGAKNGMVDNSQVYRNGILTHTVKFPPRTIGKYIAIKLVSNSDYPIIFIGGQIIGKVIN